MISHPEYCKSKLRTLDERDSKFLRRVSRLRLKCDGTRAETRYRPSVKGTSPFKSAGASVQSTTGGRGVGISGSNAGYTMFRGRVKSIGYSLHSPVSAFTSPPVRHSVPSHFNWTLPPCQNYGVIYQIWVLKFAVLKTDKAGSPENLVPLFQSALRSIPETFLL